MPDNPFAQYKKPNPFAVYKTQGTGPKAPTGYATPGNVQPLVAIPGGPDSPEHAAAVERARSMAGVPATIAEARARAQIELETERAKQTMLSGAATLDPKLDRLTGDDFLKALPPSSAATVKALVDGRMAFPAGAAMRSPYWQQMLANVAHADPNFDAVNYNARSKTRADFTSGQSARNIRSLNTAIGHLGHLSEQISGTASHGGFPLATTVNAVENAYLRGKGNSGPTLFDQTSGALASELTQVFRGSGGAEADVKRYLSELSPNASMEQKQAAVKNIAGLLQSRLEAVGDQYKQGMGKTIDPIQLLNPHAQKAFSAILGPDASGGDGGPPPNAPPPAPPVLPGATPATGDTHAEAMDPKTAAIITAMIGNHMSADEMNRILVPAKLIGPQGFKQEDIDKYQKTLAAGGSLSPQFEKPNTLFNKIASSPAGVGVGAAFDGSMGGLTDEATGAVNWARGQGSLSDLIAAADAKKQAAYAADPRASGWGNAAGSMTSALAGGMLLKGTTAALALGKAAPFVGGAVYGGISGAGQNNNDRVDGGGMGTVAGLMGTGAGQVAAIPVGALARSMPGLAATNGVRRLFGRAGITPQPSLSPAETSLFGAATKAGPDTIGSQLDQAANLGVPMSLADTAPEMTSLGGQAVRRSPTASGVAESAFQPRARGQIDRFGNAIARDLGPVENVPQLSKDYSKSAAANAKPFYDDAYAAGQVDDPAINTLLQHPDLQPILKDAQQLHSNDVLMANARGEIPPSDLIPVMGPDGKYTAPDVRTIDYIQRALRNKVDAAYSGDAAGKMNAPFFKDARNLILSRTDEAVPAFGAARKAYGGPMQSKDALEFGQKSISMDPNALGVELQGKSPEQLAQIQLGNRSGLMGQADKLRYSSNPFDGTLGTPAAEQRMTALYGADHPGVTNLLAQRDMEGQLAKSANDILGNSKTAQRQIADKAFAGPDMGDMATAAVDLAHGGVPVGTIAKAGLSRAGMAFSGRRAAAKADELAPMVFNTDPRSAKAILDDLLARQAARSQYVQGMRPTNVMGYLGGGFGASAAQGF